MCFHFFFNLDSFLKFSSSEELLEDDPLPLSLDSAFFIFGPFPAEGRETAFEDEERLDFFFLLWSDDL